MANPSSDPSAVSDDRKLRQMPDCMGYDAPPPDGVTPLHFRWLHLNSRLACSRLLSCLNLLEKSENWTENKRLSQVSKIRVKLELQLRPACTPALTHRPEANLLPDPSNHNPMIKNTLGATAGLTRRLGRVELSVSEQIFVMSTRRLRLNDSEGHSHARH